MVIWASPPLIERIPIYMTKRAKILTAQWPPPDPVPMLPCALFSKNKPKSAALFPPSQSLSCHGLNTIFLPHMKSQKNFIKQSQNSDLVGIYALRPFFVGFAPFPRPLRKCYVIKEQGIKLFSIPPFRARQASACPSVAYSPPLPKEHFKKRRNEPNSSARSFPPNSLLSIIVPVNIARFLNPAIPFGAHDSTCPDHPP
jgi:hypothetical protein